MVRTWAHLDDTGHCLNTLLLDPDAAPDYPRDGLIDITDEDPMPGIGWTFDGTAWTPPTPPPAPVEPSP